MSKKLLATPYGIWILGGTVIPLVIIAYYGMTGRDGSLTFSNLTAMFSEIHLEALGLALAFALASTAVCLILAFPLALVLREIKWGEKGFILFVFILPMWMNFLLRTMAWQVIMEKGGLFNTLLSTIGLPTIDIINTPYAIILGMVYDFLPFMVMPIYNTIIKIDSNLIEAAYDLGARPFTVLKEVILPMAVPGIASGITMVFVPSLTTFAIPNMLGGGKYYLIGNIIEQEFTSSANWNLGSGLSLVMMLFIVVSMLLVHKTDKDGEGGGLI